jgi:ATP-binding cassette, subfamily A (ABC1), member 3
MLPPTAGDAYMFGQSINRDMKSIRQNLGVCPQHNILWPLLTVKEHLQLFAALKGVPKKDVESQVMTMIDTVGLNEKVHVKSAALSGGQQRKLSVGIALIGDSKIIFLDEPTSGMELVLRLCDATLILYNLS